MSQPTRTIIYTRVSTDKQAAEGVSLEAQRAKALAYAGLYDLEVVSSIEDAGHSAKTLTRPGLQRALAMLDRGEADALLVVKLDRLTRSVRDLDSLISRYFGREQGPALMSVSEQIDTRSAAGRLVLNVLAAVSQWEREAIGERTSTAMAHKRQEGGFVGGRLRYGWRAQNGRVVPHRTEQLTVARARELRAQGRTLTAVAYELEAEGLLSRSGKRFTPTQIRRFCVGRRDESKAGRPPIGGP